MGFGLNSPESFEILKEMQKRGEEKSTAKRKKDRARSVWMTIGRWIASNIVAIGALAVAVIALVRTF